jgi:hypothetical protein
VGLETSIGAIVATLDLQLVRLLRDAMNVADVNSAKDIAGVPTSQSDRFEQRPVIHPEPRYEPRQVIHPTPRYEPRPVIHPTPRIEQQNNCCPPPPPCEPDPCETIKSPLLPPWKTLPCDIRQPAPVQIKIIVQHPDIHHKGSLIDLFI